MGLSGEVSVYVLRGVRKQIEPMIPRNDSFRTDSVDDVEYKDAPL